MTQDEPTRAERQDQIFMMVGALSIYWMQHPELRLGQVIGNMASGVGDTYYVEDAVLLQRLREGWPG